MLDIAVILVVSYAVLTVVGAAALSLVPERLRDALTPALPALGAMALVVGLHLTSIAVPVRVGAPLLALAVVVQLARARPRPFSRLLLAATVAGLLPLAMALVPQLRVGEPTVVQPNFNNDAYAYVTLSAWVTDHRPLDRPDPHDDAPAFGYVRTHIEGGLRVGEELAQSALALANGRDPSATWYTVLALWLFLLPGTFMAAARLIGMSPWAGLAAGVLAGLAAPVVGQVHTQNSASTLGIALAPLALALVVRALRHDDTPPWLAGAAVSAFIGTYSEFLPLVAPGLAVLALFTWRRALLIGVWALATGPLVWFNAVRSLVDLSDYTAPGSISAYLDVPFGAKLNRVLGVTTTVGGNVVSVTTIVLALAVLAGLIACVWLATERRFWMAYLAGSALMIVYLSTAHRFPYGQQRAVEITHPLWLLAAVCGFDALLRRVRLRWLVGVPLVVLAGLFVRANYRTADVVASGPAVLARSMDGDFAEADRWLEDMAGEDGSGAVVLDADFFQQLWLVYQSRDQREIAFPFLYPDYHVRGRYDFYDGRPRRYALVGRSVYVSADPGMVVRENERFRLLDLSKGEALLAAPTVNFSPPDLRADDPSYWMQNDGELVVLRSAGVQRIRLTGGALSQLAPLPLDVQHLDDGRVLGSAAVTADPTVFDVPLPDGHYVKLKLHNRRRAEHPTVGPDRRLLSFYLNDAERL